MDSKKWRFWVWRRKGLRKELAELVRAQLAMLDAIKALQEKVDALTGAAVDVDEQSVVDFELDETRQIIKMARSSGQDDDLLRREMKEAGYGDEMIEMALGGES